MKPRPFKQWRRLNPLHRLHTRVALLALAGVLATGAVGASLAFAKNIAQPIGTGVVVIETNLAYNGGQAAGTGMVLTSSGEILTNNHVVREATTIKVVVPGTGHRYTAKVVGYDVSADVALIKAEGVSHLKTVAIGNSAKVKVRELVKAIGNAGGTGSLTTTSGRVTAIARAITVSDDQGGTEHLSGLIEANATLEPGDSGGPLENPAGKVIGMDTAASISFGFRETSSSSDSYAIPINKAVAIAKRIEGGNASAATHIGGTAFLGVEVVANEYGGSGAMIADVVSGSPAAAAGLVPGDVITSFNGSLVSAPSKLSSLVLAAKPGEHVAVTYTDQSGTTQTTTVTLVSGPPQ
jgi:S1-C subfamily serine protease